MKKPFNNTTKSKLKDLFTRAEVFDFSIKLDSHIVTSDELKTFENITNITEYNIYVNEYGRLFITV